MLASLSPSGSGVAVARALTAAAAPVRAAQHRPPLGLVPRASMWRTGDKPDRPWEGLAFLPLGCPGAISNTITSNFCLKKFRKMQCASLIRGRRHSLSLTPFHLILY